MQQIQIHQLNYHNYLMLLNLFYSPQNQTHAQAQNFSTTVCET